MAERDLAKVEVAGSSPVIRSKENDELQQKLVVFVFNHPALASHANPLAESVIYKSSKL